MVTVTEEWDALGRELLELDPPMYRQALALLRNLLAAERKASAVDIRTYLEVLRIHLKDTA